MNAGPTAERVYDALKRRLLAHEFRPGDRLDPALLADTLSSSVTPVRDALNVLAGERLVETRKSDGFHVPSIDEPGARDLYDWNEQLLGLALRCWPKVLPADLGVPLHARSPVEVTLILFNRIATYSTNAEHALAIRAVSERLSAARHVELGLLGNVDDELTTIANCVNRDDRPALRRALAGYHRRRHRVAAAIVRALYRSA